MSQLWAVICGNIRDELDFRLTLQRVLELRNNKKIDQIMLSTWKGELEKIPDIKKTLVDLNIYIVENIPLNDDLQKTPTISINYWRQSVQLKAALDLIPKNDFVLRIRTDRSLNYINQMEKLGVFENYKIKTIELGKFPKFLDYKITVFGPKMVRILHMIDFALLGQNRDLRKLLNFEVMELLYNKQIVANAQWYQNPFILKFPILNSYQEMNIFSHKIKIMREYVELNKNNSVFPEIDFKVYAVYFLILYTNFNIIYVNELKSKPEGKLSFYNFFTNYGDSIITTALGSAIREQSVLEDIINGRIEKDLSYDKIMYYINHLISHGADEVFDLTYSDCLEMWNLNNNNFYNTDLKWFKPLKNTPLNPMGLKINKNNDVDLNILDIDFKTWSNLSSSRKIEIELFNNWKKIKNKTFKTTELMLLPPAKTGNVYAQYVLLKLWNKNKISENNFSEIQRLIFFYINYHVNRNVVNNIIKRVIILFLLVSKAYNIEGFKYEKYLRFLFVNASEDFIELIENTDNPLPYLRDEVEKLTDDNIINEGNIIFHFLKFDLNMVFESEKLIEYVAQKNLYNDLMLFSLEIN